MIKHYAMVPTHSSLPNMGYTKILRTMRAGKITPRMCLTHSTGFSNFWFIEPDKKLHINFEPGTRYSYSGEGLILLQLAIEHRRAQTWGLTSAISPRQISLAGTCTSLVWRDSFATSLANGWNDQPREHDRRSKVQWRARWTPISDMARFTAVCAGMV
ncbi:MAG: hypothetical protein WKF37_09015 [Bryobacteraceae bacterium]